MSTMCQTSPSVLQLSDNIQVFEYVQLVYRSKFLQNWLSLRLEINPKLVLLGTIIF